MIEVEDGLHPAASHNMPWFISGPHEGDALYVITTVTIIAAVVGLGVLFFTLHSLPERLGHKKIQFEIVAVLACYRSSRMCMRSGSPVCCSPSLISQI